MMVYSLTCVEKWMKVLDQMCCQRGVEPVTHPVLSRDRTGPPEGSGSGPLQGEQRLTESPPHIRTIWAFSSS